MQTKNIHPDCLFFFPNYIYRYIFRCSPCNVVTSLHTAHEFALINYVCYLFSLSLFLSFSLFSLSFYLCLYFSFLLHYTNTPSQTHIHITHIHIHTYTQKTALQQCNSQFWTFSQCQLKKNANRRMAAVLEFVWMCTIVIDKAAHQKENVHLALVHAVSVSTIAKAMPVSFDW